MFLEPEVQKNFQSQDVDMTVQTLLLNINTFYKNMVLWSRNLFFFLFYCLIPFKVMMGISFSSLTGFTLDSPSHDHI